MIFTATPLNETYKEAYLLPGGAVPGYAQQPGELAHLIQGGREGPPSGHNPAVEVTRLPGLAAGPTWQPV